MFFAEFKLTVFENKRTFLKKAMLHAAILMNCKTRQVLRDISRTNQGNDSVMAFVAGASNSNLSNLKT